MALHGDFVRELSRALDSVDEDTLMELVDQVVSHRRVRDTNMLARVLATTAPPPPVPEESDDSASESDASTVVEVQTRLPAASDRLAIGEALSQGDKEFIVTSLLNVTREEFADARVGAEFRAWLDEQTRESARKVITDIEDKFQEEAAKLTGAMTRAQFNAWVAQTTRSARDEHISTMAIAAEVETARLAALDVQAQETNASRPRLPSVSPPTGSDSEQDAQASGAQERVDNRRAHAHVHHRVRVQPAQENDDAQPVRRPIPRDTATEKWRVRYRIPWRHVVRLADATDAQIRELDFQNFSEIHVYLGYSRSTHVPPPKGDPWLLDARFRLDAIEQLFYNDRHNCRVNREIAAARKKSAGHRRGG